VTPAIRIQRLRKYFGGPVDLDGARNPGDVWRTLLRIAGLRRAAATGDIRTTIAAAGYVIDDLTLDIERGSVVCLAGASGAGKSVLLRLLAGVIPPTAGRIEMQGPVGSLLSLSGNLDARLTAVENIENFRRLARLPRSVRHTEEILDFAELGGFEHMPVRTYSKGMTMRLHAALAVAGDPAVVLVDDVLGVGDLAFQRKFVERLHALKERGCTLVAAFEDESLVEEIATRVLTLQNGRVVSDRGPRRWGHVHQVSRSAELEWDLSPNLPEDEVMALRRVEVEEAESGDGPCLQIAHLFEAKAGGLTCRPNVFLMRDRTVVFRSLYPTTFVVETPGRVAVSVSIPTAALGTGDYRITSNMLAVRGGVNHSLKGDTVTLTVRRDAGAVAAGPARSTPLLAVDVPWELERVTAVAS
jgi:lipopolysaccharide transport system ATP-binding protein